MKTKLFIFSGATALVMSAAALLLVQSCSKNESHSLKPSNTSPKKGVEGGTVAYEDTIATNWFKRNSNSLGSIAFDHASSVLLSSGKVLWLMGDTFYNDLNSDGTTPCLFNHHNTILQQPSISNWTQSATTNLTYDTSPQIFTAVSPDYFWPGNGIEIGTSVYTYLTVINNSTGAEEPGQVGVLNESTNAVSYTTVTLPDLKGVNFASGMFQVDTTVYVYGTKLLSGYGNTHVFVAKFSTSSPATWTFWNGSSWAATMPDTTRTNLTPVVATTASNALTVNYVNGKYVMIYTQFDYYCNGGTNIYATTSTSPTGGFGTPASIYNIPDEVDGNTPKFYTPCIHPEFNANSQFMFTYCINNYAPCIAQCISSEAQPDYYRPRAVWVPYSVLGL
jgi:hypothetical protein